MRGFFLRSAFLLVLGLFFGLSFSYTYAEEPAPESCGNYINGEESYPIEDCANPFGVVTPNENLKISFGDTVLEEGKKYPLLNTKDEFHITGTHPEAFLIETILYKKEGNDYRYVAPDSIRYMFSETGTYILVVTEDTKPVQVFNPLKRLFDILIPTAYAFPGTSLVLTFEVVETPEKPHGISNILFLPGLQASRLYTKDEDGDEEKLWEPGGDDDVLRLAMTETGESVEDIYAKEVIEELGEVAIGQNIYKGFLDFLDGLGTTHLKPTIGTFPYDWRHDVFDVVEKGIKNNDDSYTGTVEAIEYLATTSVTGKVTLIAHSNGGLLAKAIMRKLEDEGKTDLVDKVIFIAVPHIGTPKGIMALLHGYDQSHSMGFSSTEEGVRKAIKNMPGVYGLLPSEKYISTLSEPMISFDDSSLTKSYRDAYGLTLGNMDEYTRFLKGTEGRTYDDDRVNEASTANSAMLEKALQKHRTELDNWEAPEGVEVFNIVGTGLPTPKSIEYREFVDTVCAGLCIPDVKIEPVIHFTNYGDQTVVSKSAKSMEINNIYVNILRANLGVRNRNREHADITESETIQDVINHILHGSSTNSIDFVTDTETVLSNNTDIVTIHSPARIYIQDARGNITGRTTVDGEWKSEIPGSTYFEAGSVKYVLVPSDGTYSIIIEGEGTGVYTHEIKRLRGDTEVSQHQFTATVTPTTVATYTKKEGVLSDVVVDTNGDGKIDVIMSQDGAIIPKPATYSDLSDALATLSLPVAQKRFLVGLAHQAEEYSKSNKRVQRIGERIALVLIRNKIEAYQKASFITIEKRQEIGEIINDLLIKK